ncbi:MAG: toll/interleukin-1 receptor domain-containing protein [Aggregatilineales bacterium]
MTTHDEFFSSEVFICYSHQDRGLIEALTANLNDSTLKNLAFWFDRSIERGTKWKDEIDTHLSSSFAVLVVATIHSNASPWCTYEWARALGMGKTVIPLIYNTEHIHEKLAEINGYDFSQGQHPYPEIKQRLTQLHQAQRLSPTLRMFNELLNGRDTLPTPADFLNVAFELGLVTDRQYQEANRWLRSLISQRMKNMPSAPLPTKPVEDTKKTPATSSKPAAAETSKPPAGGTAKAPTTDNSKTPPIGSKPPVPDGSKTPAPSVGKPPDEPPKPPNPPGKAP